MEQTIKFGCMPKNRLSCEVLVTSINNEQGSHCVCSVCLFFFLEDQGYVSFRSGPSQDPTLVGPALGDDDLRAPLKFLAFCWTALLNKILKSSQHR